MAVEQRRLREVRDAILRYCYEHGASMPFFSVDERAMQRDLGFSNEEISAAAMLMINQGLTPGPRQGIVGMIGLGERGQEEAERLGPATMLREPPPAPPPTSITAIGDNSIFQFAGANSVQNATANWSSSEVRTVLEQIERELPALPLAPEQKEHAGGLLRSLHHAIRDRLPAAGVTAIAGALASVLDGGGSELGRRLVEAIAQNAS